MERRSWLGAIIANLATLRINEVQLPIAVRRTFDRRARTTALQGEVFALLGVPAASVYLFSVSRNRSRLHARRSPSVRPRDRSRRECLRF
jgi:hypothetical protein